MDDIDLLVDLHRTGERQGPGDASDTRLSVTLSGLSEAKGVRIADIGCGSGASTLVLARELDAHVTAVDLYQGFLDELRNRAEREGLTDRVTPLAASMDALPLEEAAFDAIWSEGAIYLLGFEHGLEAWRKFLKPGGFVAVSECTWLTATPSDEARAFWEAAYPTMGTIASNCEAAVRAGFEIIGTHVLNEDDWWAEYYTPMRARIAEMRATYGEAAEEVLANEEAEIALFENNPGQYSYVFYVLRRKG